MILRWYLVVLDGIINRPVVSLKFIYITIVFSFFIPTIPSNKKTEQKTSALNSGVIVTANRCTQNNFGNIRVLLWKAHSWRLYSYFNVTTCIYMYMVQQLWRHSTPLLLLLCREFLSGADHSKLPLIVTF